MGISIQKDDNIILQVKDDGIGIPEDDLTESSSDSTE